MKLQKKILLAVFMLVSWKVNAATSAYWEEQSPPGGCTSIGFPRWENVICSISGNELSCIYDDWFNTNPTPECLMGPEHIDQVTHHSILVSVWFVNPGSEYPTEVCAEDANAQTVCWNIEWGESQQYGWLLAYVVAPSSMEITEKVYNLDGQYKGVLIESSSNK